MQWLVASNNQFKSADLVRCLAHYGLVAKNYRDQFPPLDFPTETTTDYQQNALTKARFAFEQYHQPMIADDSGIEISALGSKLGVTTARDLAKRPANISRNAYLLALMANQLDRRATMRTHLAAITKTGRIITAQGLVRGYLAEKPAGDFSGGFDRIFIPSGYQHPLATLPDAQRIPLSHRGQAAQQLVSQLV